MRSLHGDRTTPDGLAALAAEGDWDAVVDTWSAAPRAVRDTARLLRGRAGRYVYVSSCSVYAWAAARAGTARTRRWSRAPRPTRSRPTTRGTSGAASWPAVEEFGADRSLLVRAGLLLGPYENIGRLPWWLTRIARGGPVLAPGPRELPLQYIDIRDLADWILGAVDEGLSGPYNLVGPQGHTTMGELLDACVGGHRRRRPNCAGPTRCRSSARASSRGPSCRCGCRRAATCTTPCTARTCPGRVAAGLRCRPVAETVADTWRWLRDIGGAAPQRPDRTAVGLDPEVEAKVLAAEADAVGGGVPGTTS